MDTLKNAIFILLAAYTGASCALAQPIFLDLNSVTPGSMGGFSGMLGAVKVDASVTSAPAGFRINGMTGTNSWEESTINNSSAQWSYHVFAPTIPLADRVGYTSFKGTFNPATITMEFSAPVVDPIFEFANLDAMIYDFSQNAGLSLVKLNGDGGSGDGLLATGNLIADANPQTGIGQDPSQQPLLSGDRSAYGSVQLLGDFTSLTIELSNPTERGDGGSFTLALDPGHSSPESAPAPEPTSTSITLVGLVLTVVGSNRKGRSEV